MVHHRLANEKLLFHRSSWFPRIVKIGQVRLQRLRRQSVSLSPPVQRLPQRKEGVYRFPWLSCLAMACSLWARVLGTWPQLGGLGSSSKKPLGGRIWWQGRRLVGVCPWQGLGLFSGECDRNLNLAAPYTHSLCIEVWPLSPTVSTLCKRAPPFYQNSGVAISVPLYTSNCELKKL